MGGDRKSVQMQRIKLIVGESQDGIEPHFDDDAGTIKFIMRTKFPHTPLTPVIEWKVDEVEKLSDDEVRKHIKAMGAGRI